MEDTVIAENINLVRFCLKKYGLINDEDMFQIGCIGLLKAVRTYDKTRNVTFSTFACECIYNELKREFKKLNAEMRKTEKMKVYYQENITNMDDETYENVLFVDDDFADDLIDKIALKQAFDKLNDKQKATIFGYYISELSCSQIGKVVNVSRQAIDQRHKTALRILRENLQRG